MQEKQIRILYIILTITMLWIPVKKSNFHVIRTILRKISPGIVLRKKLRKVSLFSFITRSPCTLDYLRVISPCQKSPANYISLPTTIQRWGRFLFPIFLTCSSNENSVLKTVGQRRFSSVCF